jgi:hypothetical protein
VVQSANPLAGRGHASLLRHCGTLVTTNRVYIAAHLHRRVEVALRQLVSRHDDIEADLGCGRIAASEIELPNMLVNMV